MILKIFNLVLLASMTCALYESKGDVVELTATNFQKEVIKSDAIWIVEFYAPWCGHCKNLVPAYKKAAKALKGLVKVGAVDMTQHQSVGGPYNVQGFPTIKIFGANKNKPTDFNGQRTAEALVEAAIKEVTKTANSRLGGKSSSGSSSSGGKGGKNEVIELTESNFEKLVLNSKDLWLVEFFAPWCGHCKNLEPHWKAAASELKGKVKLGAVDATVHAGLAQKFGIQGYPTIKFFGAGLKKYSDAENYEGGRTSQDIVNWAMNKVAENRPPPEVLEILNQEQVEENCKDKQLCIFAILPHILDCQSKCRNKYISDLKEVADRYKKNIWAWGWTEAGKQNKLEEAFGVGGFGYPAMVAVNPRKQKYSILKGSFGVEGISEFVRDLSYGKGQTLSMTGDKFPTIVKVEAWDGKDGVMPVEEDIDLSDVDLGDIKTEL
uniref:Protein disulfide-isomerase A6 homolog n=1 Tax=Parastrongyloides trichosuri TaxID=131310 RepID=A0A0N4ZQP4_PARTI